MTLDELKEQKIWFLWNYAPGKNGKKTKVPMSANGGITGTSDNYSNTWTDYDSAVTAKEKHGVAGIGFKIPDNMYFLDIDGRPLEDSFVQLLLERHDTYAETSPSGNGIHILGTCDNKRLPLIKDETKGRITVARDFYQKNPNNHIELYFGHATNRYATFTGNAINDKELTDGTEACLTTLDKDMRRKGKTNYSPARDGDREAFDITCNLRRQKNGEKFSKLYDHGDWQGCGYGSQSEADAGLCSMLAFRTGPDPEAIDSLFRESALYRPKWDRDDYRENTIWLMNDTTALQLRTLKDEAGNYLWNTASDTILGKPVVISEYMPDIESGNKPVVFGDFSYYWIIDRDPVSMSILKELYLNTGHIGYLAYEFLDGKLIRNDAIKAVKISENV